MSIIYPVIHFSLALIEWVLISWAIRLWQQSTSLAMIVLPIVLVSISYDNIILSIGSLIGEGELLKTLSMLRFLLHYLVVPLFIVIGVELAHRAGASWANRVVRVLSWLIALGLTAIDVATHYLGLELVSIEFAGILRYHVANLSGPPIITIVVNLFVLLKLRVASLRVAERSRSSLCCPELCRWRSLSKSWVEVRQATLIIKVFALSGS
ncbi:MAG: hypothetical protein V7K88_05930 [Nostoc sp.]|uniref:hypothetical protein n=1 Tax=Nostoc sp. TaxID=1180 RepID=UPI002FF7BBAE